MRLLLDVGVSPRAVRSLTSDGHVATHVSSLGMHAATDKEIADWAKARGHVVITFDRDFPSLLARTGETLPSLVYLRLPKTTVDEMIELIRTAVRRFESDLLSGAVVTIKPLRIHCRPLPIHRDLDQ